MHPSVENPAATALGRLRKHLGDWLASRGARVIAPDEGQATELVSIATHPTSTTTEGWVEQISLCEEGSEVRLALADGTPVKLRLQEGDVEWLGLGVNQIVPLQWRRPSAREPGVALLRECVDIGG